MQYRHDDPDLPEPLISERTGDRFDVSLPEGPPATFALISVPSLTRRTAEELIERNARSGKRVFISYGRSSPEARAALQAAGISFSGGDGHAFVRAPGIFVSRDERARAARGEGERFAGDAASSARNPFARRSSRIPRWLLLHHDEAFSIAELADAAGLNPGGASRIVRALEDDALVREVAPLAGTRRRQIELGRPRALLDAWLPLWQRRRVRERHWDIGTRNADEAARTLREAIGDRTGWALGGLSGAATKRRAVEPTDVLVWTTADELPTLANRLQPEATHAGRGGVRIALAPDPWTLGLARMRDGVPIADDVQLWLDCASEGERALEAADAIALAAGWS